MFWHFLGTEGVSSARNSSRRRLLSRFVGERMRDALNNNPLVHLGVLAALLLAVAVFLMSSGGGGEEKESAGSGTTEATVSVAGTDAGGTASEAAAGEPLSSALSAVNQAAATAPPLPGPVLDAWKANRTLVLLFVRDGGIDDRLMKTATDGLAWFRNTAVFVVPAAEISRYAAITEGVGVDRVPALVVVTPKHLKKSVPTASVSYGFQSSQSVAQAVIDAGYKGPTVDYHPCGCGSATVACSLAAEANSAWCRRSKMASARSWSPLSLRLSGFVSITVANQESTVPEAQASGLISVEASPLESSRRRTSMYPRRRSFADPWGSPTASWQMPERRPGRSNSGALSINASAMSR